MDRKQYEEDLLRKQKEHLKNINISQDLNWQPCLHDECFECHGTGRKLNGQICVHLLSCPCPKCKIII